MHVDVEAHDAIVFVRAESQLHSELPGDDDEPEEHAEHIVAPGASEKVPAGQTAHVGLPMLDVNVPAAHGEHDAAFSALKEPRLH